MTSLTNVLAWGAIPGTYTAIDKYDETMQNSSAMARIARVVVRVSGVVSDEGIGGGRVGAVVGGLVGSAFVAAFGKKGAE